MNAESESQKKERVRRIIAILKQEYPDARVTLDFSTPHQLLVAAILAAQSTDERVNQVTPELFKKYPTVESFANADAHELEDMVRSTGFFRNKTRAIIESAKEIVENFGGKVPDNVDDLTSLSGVGRKTANLIVGVAYGQPAVIVDTHVKRVTGRLGLTDQKDPDKIEADLRKILLPEDATQFNHQIVAHGREVCKAPKPRCEVCKLLELCPYGQKEMAGRLKV